MKFDGNDSDAKTQSDAIAVWENEGGRMARRVRETRHERTRDKGTSWAVYRVSAGIGGRNRTGHSRLFAGGGIRPLHLREITGQKRRDLRTPDRDKADAGELTP